MYPGTSHVYVPGLSVSQPLALTQVVPVNTFKGNVLKMLVTGVTGTASLQQWPISF